MPAAIPTSGLPLPTALKCAKSLCRISSPFWATPLPKKQRRLLMIFCFVNPSIHLRTVWRETPKRLLILRMLRQGPSITLRHVTTNTRENLLCWCAKSGCRDRVRPVRVHKNRKIISGKGCKSSPKPLRQYHPWRIKQSFPMPQYGQVFSRGILFSLPCCE